MYKVIWGAGYYYNTEREYIKYEIKPDYIYDKKFNGIEEFDGYKTISINEIKQLPNCEIILAFWKRSVGDEIISQWRTELSNCTFVFLSDLIHCRVNISIEDIISNSQIIDDKRVFTDNYGNSIEYYNADDLNNISMFVSNNCKISLGRNISAGKLKIDLGNNSEVNIGDNTTIEDAVIDGAFSIVTIGSNCMISLDVIIRTHDVHCIFDLKSGDRINYSKDVVIGDNVWVCQRAVLLPGFHIGNGSIVGAGSVTSSKFPNNVIVAGNPAKVIRENVCWDRAFTYIRNYDNINQINV